MFYRYEHYMSILHMAIFVYMATQHKYMLFQEHGVGLHAYISSLSLFIYLFVNICVCVSVCV